MKEGTRWYVLHLCEAALEPHVYLDYRFFKDRRYFIVKISHRLNKISSSGWLNELHPPTGARSANIPPEEHETFSDMKQL